MFLLVFPDRLLAFFSQLWICNSSVVDLTVYEASLLHESKESFHSRVIAEIISSFDLDQDEGSVSGGVFHFFADCPGSAFGFSLQRSGGV